MNRGRHISHMCLPGNAVFLLNGLNSPHRGAGFNRSLSEIVMGQCQIQRDLVHRFGDRTIGYPKED